MRDQGNGFDGVGEYGFVKMIEVSKNENEKNPAKWSNVFPLLVREIYFIVCFTFIFLDTKLLTINIPKEPNNVPHMS